MGEGLTSFNKNNRANVFGKKTYDETLQGVFFKILTS